ncbi:MAG: hypothetical protein AB8G23_13230 [Myxococcota bacterium]
MKNFRGDVLYLVGFALVAVAGYALAMQFQSDDEMFSVDPTYRGEQLGQLPEYAVDMANLPFASRAMGAYTGPTIPRRWFADKMETALADIRLSLLNASAAEAAQHQAESNADQLAAVAP